MGCTVHKPIDPDCLSAIPGIKQMLRSLPKEMRTCSECAEEVIIHESDFQPAPVNGPITFNAAAFVGCDAAIDRVIEAILRQAADQGLSLSDCFQSKKS